MAPSAANASRPVVTRCVEASRILHSEPFLDGLCVVLRPSAMLLGARNYQTVCNPARISSYRPGDTGNAVIAPTPPSPSTGNCRAPRQPGSSTPGEAVLTVEQLLRSRGLPGDAERVPLR